MMITLRLYRQHDLDLITLYKHPAFSLPMAMKKALSSYVNQEQLEIQQPTPFDIGTQKIPKIIQMHIVLNEHYDKEIIDWIKSIKEGYRNSVLKNLIRGYMNGPCIYNYSCDNETSKIKFENNKNIFEANTKEILILEGQKTKRKSSKTKKEDNRKVEDSELAKQILSNKKEENKNIKFVERIADDDYDVKKLEEITAVKKETIIHQEETESKELVMSTDDDLGSMLDDIDAMMNF